MEETLKEGSEGYCISSNPSISIPIIGTLVRMETYFKVIEAGPKEKRKEFTLLDQNFKIVLINSISREMFIGVNLTNLSIPREAHWVLKGGYNRATHTTHSLGALVLDVVGFTIGFKSFPKVVQLEKEVKKELQVVKRSLL